jgi:hypothetical protein
MMGTLIALSLSRLFLTSAFSQEFFVAGYCNTTSAVNAVQFKFTSGNIDDGIFKLYGVKKS